VEDVVRKVALFAVVTLAALEILIAEDEIYANSQVVHRKWELDDLA